MNDNLKLDYATPVTEVMELVEEGVVCASGSTEQFGSGYSYDDSDFD